MTPVERIKRWLKLLVAVGVSVLFSWLFVRSIDIGEAADSLADANYVYVVPALGLFALSLVVRSLRWQAFYLPGHRIEWRRLVSPLLIGYAGNNMLPLRAGELLRAQFVAEREGTPRMVTFGVLMMERLFDGFVLGSFLVWGLLVAGRGGAYLGGAALLVALSVFGFIAGAVLAKYPWLPGRLVARPLPFLSDRVRGDIQALSMSFLEGFSVLTRWRLFLAAAATTAVAWLLELSMYWVIAQGFDLGVDFLTIAFAGSAANVAMSLPAAQGGVGPFQLVALKALEEFEVGASAAGAYAVALHLFLVGPVSIVGLLALWRVAAPSRATRRVPAPTVGPAE